MSKNIFCQISLLIWLIIMSSCKTSNKPTPFDKGNKWYSVNNGRKLPILMADSIYIYQIDTTELKDVQDYDEYNEKIYSALKLKSIYKITYSDSLIKYIENQPNGTKYDTVEIRYKLLLVDSIPLLQLHGSEFLIAWDSKKNYGKADTISVNDFVSEVELGGVKIGQKINETDWIKTGEEIDIINNVVLGKYKSRHNDNIEALVFDNNIVSVSNDDMSSLDVNELKRIFKYYEKKSVQKDSTTKEDYFEEEWFGKTDNGFSISIYKSRNYYIYGMLISRGKYYVTIRNHKYLGLLSILKSARDTKLD